MSPHDVIPLPGHPGMFARRVIVEAWQEAGSPPVNDAGRLKAAQQKAWDAFQNGTGSPADDPNRPEKFPLAHVRFVALDITPTPDRVRRLKAAGLVRPYPYEEWHWQLANVYAYALVTSIPSPVVPTIERLLMDKTLVKLISYSSPSGRNGMHLAGPGFFHTFTAEEWEYLSWQKDSEGKTLLDGVPTLTPPTDRAFDVQREFYLSLK